MAEYVILTNTSGVSYTTLDNNTLEEQGGGQGEQGPSWDAYPEAVVGRALIVYVYPVVIVLGTVGNVLSVAVLTRRSMRATSVYLYLALLAVADLSVLYLSGLRAWARQVFGAELLHTSTAGCKTVMFLFLVSLHLSAWLVVAMTVDRFIAVWFPFKAAELCSVSRARLVCVLCTMTLLLYNSHVLFTVSLHDLGYKWHCGAMRGDYFMTAVFPTMKLISYSVLPFTLVLIFNGAIIARLWLSRTFVAGAARGGAAPSGQGGTVRGRQGQAAPRGPQHKVTVMLLAVSLTWLVLTGPFTLEPLIRFDGRSGRAMARLYLSKSVCFLLLYANHSVNFYIYCVTGRRFRLQLLEFFWSCVPRSRSRGRLQSNIESRTSRTQLQQQQNRHSQNNGEVIPLRKTVMVTYSECV